MSEEHTPSDVLRSARRIIVKVGSTLVTNEGRGLDAAAVGEWCRQLALLEAGGGSQRREVVMVSSGAIAEAPRLGEAPQRRERAAGGRCRRPDGAGADV